MRGNSHVQFGSGGRAVARPADCNHLMPLLATGKGLLVEYCESAQALWCPGVPAQACISGNGLVRSPGNNVLNLPVSRRGRPREVPESWAYLGMADDGRPDLLVGLKGRADGACATAGAGLGAA